MFAFCIGLTRPGISQDAATTEPQAWPPPDSWLPSLPESAGQTDDMTMRDQSLIDPETPPYVAPTNNSGRGHVFNKWKIIPYATVGATYDSNVFISEMDPQQDEYFTIGAGVAAGWGAVRRDSNEYTGYFRHADTPNLEIDQPEEGNFVLANIFVNQTYFVDHSSQNSLNPDASIAAEWRFEKILFGAHIRYLSLSDLDIDVGGRVLRDVLSAKVTSQYSVSDKTSVEVNFSSSATNYQNGNSLNSTEYSNQNWLDYQLTGKIQTGVGLTLGSVNVENSPNQTFEQVLVRASYLATGKLAINATGGFEVRQIQDGNRVEPVFTLGATYSPTDQTSVRLEAFRQVFSSGTRFGEDILTTGVVARIRQRLLEKFYLTLAGGYQHGQYEEIVQGVAPKRIDDSLFFRSSISFDYTKWTTLELAYVYNNNQSTEPDRSFKQNLISLQLNFFF